MALDFTGSVTDFIEAIKEIMAMQKLSDFASEEKGKARLNDYTNPFVRLLLLAMPAFLADSEVLLNAVNKEYFDKLFVFVLSWESAKLYFQKESENEAVLEELSKLMQMTARDLLLALEKELATSGIPDVQDFLATGDMSAIVIPPKSKVGLFADFDHHKEKKDFALA